MAYANFKASVQTSLSNGDFLISAAGGGTPTGSVSTTTLSTDVTAVDTAITAIETALTAINGLTGFTALTGAVAGMSTATAAATAAHAAVDTVETDITGLSAAVSQSGDVVLSFDAATVTTYNKLKAAVDILLNNVRASGKVT